MSTHRALTSMLLVLCTLTACSAAPPRTGTVSSSRANVMTGSLVAIPGPNPALQVVTRDDITVTGHTSLGPALRELVPSLQ